MKILKKWRDEEAPVFEDSSPVGWRVWLSRTQGPMDTMTWVRPPSGAQEKLVCFSKSKNLVWLTVGVPNPRVYKHDQVRTLKIL